MQSVLFSLTVFIASKVTKSAVFFYELSPANLRGDVIRVNGVVASLVCLFKNYIYKRILDF